MEKEQKQKQETKEPEPQLKVVLNGGKMVLDSATVPIEWYLSKELAEKLPTEMLLIDFSEKEIASGKDLHQRGTRAIISIKDRNDYIMFTSSGTHKIYILVAKQNVPEGSLHTEYDSFYKTVYANSISIEDLDNFLNGKECEDHWLKNNFLEIISFEVVIPDEFFAHKPAEKSSAWKKFVWRWANSWYRNDPVDQCEYRKRAINAFSFQVLVEFICLAIRILTSIGWIIWVAFVIILGFVPNKNFWKDLKSLWIGPLTRWHKDNITTKYNFHIIAIWEFLILGVIVWWVWAGFPYWRGIASIIVGAGIIMLLIWLFGSLKERIEDKKYSIKRSKEEGYLQWLLENANLENAPGSIKYGTLGKAFDKKGAHQRKLWFWATKSKVCKPYSK